MVYSLSPPHDGVHGLLLILVMEFVRGLLLVLVFPPRDWVCGLGVLLLFNLSHVNLGVIMSITVLKKLYIVLTNI